MEGRLKEVIKCGCSLRSKPVVAAQLGPASQRQDATLSHAACSHSTRNLGESVFALMQRVNVQTTKCR